MKTFVYPGCVDYDVPCYVDGAVKNVGRDAAVEWTLTDAYTRHVFTFKTIKSSTFYNNDRTYYAVQNILWRLYRGTADAKIYICMPRLEQGKVAHDFTKDYKGMKRTGIDIESGKIKLEAETVEVSDDLVLKRLITKGGDGGVHVEIYEGVMNVYGPNGVANWRFGVDDNNNAVLSFYDDTGKKRYDLGPRGITEIQNFDEVFVLVRDYIQVKTWSGSVDDEIRNIVSSSSMMQAIFSYKSATTYYRYSAKKTQSPSGYTYYGKDTQSDVKYANTAAEAEAADQKLFYAQSRVESSNMVKAVVREANLWPLSDVSGSLTSDPTGCYQTYSNSYVSKVTWGGAKPVYGVVLHFIDATGKRNASVNVWSNTLY